MLSWLGDWLGRREQSPVILPVHSSDVQNRDLLRALYLTGFAVKRAPIDFQIAFYRKRRCPERFDVNRIALLKSPHMQLAGRRIRKRTMRPPVDHDSTLAANAFATVVIELHRPLFLLDEPLIEHVQHFQKRHVRSDIWQAVVD
jgi:hypothetical protein